MLRFPFVPLLLVLAACSASPIGEVGYANCTNHKDDDGDQLYDCDDPDCLSIDHCGRVALGLPTMDVGGKGGSGGTVGAPHWLPALDSGQPDEDGGFAEEDAGSDIAPLCDPACAATEVCMASGCVPVATNMPAKFLLTIKSVVAANMESRRPEPPRISYGCLDEYAGLAAIAFCYPGNCGGCVIDPFVVVYRLHEGAEQLIGMTEVVEDSFKPTFKAAPMEVELQKGDLLRFVVNDHNQSDPKTVPLFSCKPDLQELVAGPIDCAAEESTATRTLEVKATIAPIPSD